MLLSSSLPAVAITVLALFGGRGTEAFSSVRPTDHSYKPVSICSSTPHIDITKPFVARPNSSPRLSSSTKLAMERWEMSRTSSHSSKSSLSAMPAGVALDARVTAASVSAITKLLCSVGLGAVAAKRPTDKPPLDGAAVASLSKLTYWIFQPMFLLCSVATTIAAASSSKVAGGLTNKNLALMPLCALLQISIGYIFASVATSVARIKGDESRDAKMSMTFANSGPLPLLFADALFSGTVLLQEVTALISFYLLAWSPAFWSYGPQILSSKNWKDGGDSLKRASNASDSKKTKKETENAIEREVKRFCNPPVVGSLLGLLVGACVPVRNAMLRPDGALVPLFLSMKTLGSAYLPAAVLVLAGSLAGSGINQEFDEAGNKIREAGDKLNEAAEKIGDALTNRDEDDEQSSTSTGSKRSIAAIVFGRFLLAPIGAFASLKILNALKVLPPVGSRARAVVSFVILMEGCMPPAQNSVIMLQLQGRRGRAKKLAKALTIIYSLAILPVTLLLSGCLQLSEVMAFK